MKNEKRKCIFTDQPANAKFTISSDKHNWAKSVPCNKQYLTDRGNLPPTDLEIRIIELFYEKELYHLRIEHCDTQIKEIRKIIKQQSPNKTYQPVYVYPDSVSAVKDVKVLNEENKQNEEITKEEHQFTGIKKQIEKFEKEDTDNILTKKEKNDNIEEDDELWR